MQHVNFSAGIARLHSAMDTLSQNWDLMREFWSDETSRAVEENHLQPMFQQLKETIEATGRLSEVLSQARRECDPREA